MMVRAATVAFIALLLAAAPQAKTINAPRSFAAVASRLKATTRVAVLLPTRLPSWVDAGPFAIIEQSSASHYAVDIAAIADCNGAHACSFGHVYGSSKPLGENDVPGGGTWVVLGTGVKVRYVGSVNYAYPSDGVLAWESNGDYYALTLKGGSLADLVATMRSMHRY
jgi:hypothetical protein